MDEKRIISLPVGFLEVNCYVLASQRDDCVYIVDPGAEPERICRAAKSYNMDDYRILLTHAHIDHISAVKEVMASLPVSLFYLHPDDIPLYRSPANALEPIFPAIRNLPQPAHKLPDDCEFRILASPGHSRGGVCFLNESENILFSGDTIFRESIGRTDFPGGDHDTLLRSIRDVILCLPDKTVIYPGHGPPTSVGHERRYNPYLNGE